MRLIWYLILLFYCYIKVNSSSKASNGLFFNKKGRISQIEYAQEAAQLYGCPFLIFRHENSTLIVILRKYPLFKPDSFNKALLKGASRWAVASRLVTPISPRLLCVASGYPADCHHVTKCIIEQAGQYKLNYGQDPSLQHLGEECSALFYAHTLPASQARPLAVNVALLDTQALNKVCLVNSAGSLARTTLLDRERSVLSSSSLPFFLSEGREDSDEEGEADKDRAWMRELEQAVKEGHFALSLLEGERRERVEVWAVDLAGRLTSLL